MAETVTEPVLLVEVAGDGIATLTVNRPKALNALNTEVLDALQEQVVELTGKAAGILITGAGDKAFVAGADIAQMAGMDVAEAEAFSRRGQKALLALQHFRGPVVAAVNGYALGGGLELALACDVIVASSTAQMGLPETTLGIIPGFGGTQTLPRRVGPGMAKKLIFTGGRVDAKTALRIGLVDEVAPPDELLATARGILERAVGNGPLAVAEAKRVINEGLDLPLPKAIALEAEGFGRVFMTDDRKEGMDAFLEKRKPAFKGS